MSTRLVKLLAPAVLLLGAGTASAGHGGGGHGGGGHGGGHGGHSGGHHGGVHSSGYHGVHTVHPSHYSHHYTSYGYGGYGYGLGYGYGGYYPSYGYSYPAGGYYSAVPTGVVPASAGYSIDPAPSAVAAPATVTVVVPAGAQLWLDGKDVTGSDHVFTSAALQPNQPGVLSVKASWGGNTYSMQLPIRAGDKLRVDLR